MRDKELINVELLEALSCVAEQYDLLGEHFKKKAAYIRRDGLHPSRETGDSLNKEQQLIGMILNELMAKVDRLRFELGSEEEEHETT